MANGDGTTKWIMGIIASIFVAGVLGLSAIVLDNRSTADGNSIRIEGVEKTLEKMDEKLDVILKKVR